MGTALAASHAARLFWASSSTMLGFQLFFALLLGNGACKINLRDIVDEFKAYKGTLAQTGHLEKAKLTELTKRLKDKNHYGVVLDIQNYSGLRLVDPAVYIYGGWKDEKFGKLHPIDSSSRDAFAFHNTWRTTKIDSTHSSGVVSWLVLKPDGSPYTKMGTDGEVRLWVYWENTNWHCNHHKEPGLVAIDFLSILHDEDDEEEDYGVLDEEYHDAYFNQLERKKKEVSSSAEHHRGDLIAEVEMESKCNPVVTIKLASKKYKSPQVVGYADPDSEPNVILGGLGFGGKSDEGGINLWSYLLLGLVVLATIALCCCCCTVVKKIARRGRETRYGKKTSQGGEYTGVPTTESDREAFSDGEEEVSTLLRQPNRLDPEKPKVVQGESRVFP